MVGCAKAMPACDMSLRRPAWAGIAWPSAGILPGKRGPCSGNKVLATRK